MGQVGDYNVALTYETLGSAFVQVKDDDTDYELNGLRRVRRTSIAEAGTDYYKIVGASYIDHQINVEVAVRCFLASYAIDDTDSFRQVQEVYLEAGTLSETLDNVGSQKAKVIETIGADPVTPSGYSLASKQESDFEGFQTNRFTFLKNNVVLSESEDKVGSQLAIVKEVFNGTPTTPSGYSLANEQESDVDGIPTRRYTFLKDNVELSRSEDKVGSQLAIVTQVFNPTSDPTETGYSIARTEVSDVDGIPTKSFTFLKNNVVLSESEDKVGSQLAITQEVFNGTPYSPPSGYSIANTQGSDVDGIPTKRFTFLKPSILSLQQDFNNGLKRVSVQAFGMTSAAVSSELTAITGSHELISQTESDYEGIKTSTFQYQLDESFTEDYELNGLKRISIVELSTTNFTPQDIGGESETAPTTGLYLGTQEIDNGGTIKVRESVWLEAGTLRESSRNLAEGVVEVTTTFLVADDIDDEVVGPITSKTIDNFEGLKTTTFTTMQDGAGGSIINDSDSGAKLANSYEQLTSFTYPGIVDVEERAISGTGASYDSYQWSLDPPAQALIESKTFVFFQTSDEIDATDYTYDGAIKLWNPNQWAYGSTYGIGWNYTPFSQSKGFRGYRAKFVYNLSFTEGSGISGPNYLINGSRIYAGNGCGISLAGGPEDPVGKKYTLEVKITPAFEDISGATYYKKVISVATIPAQTSGAVTPTPDPDPDP
jgi:hypothetical protein